MTSRSWSDATPLSRPRASVAKSVPTTEANKRTSRPALSRWSEATTDHVSHPLRHPTPQGQRVRQLAQLPFSGKEPNRLADKQGIAVGLSMQRRDQPRRKRQAVGTCNEPGDVGL